MTDTFTVDGDTATLLIQGLGNTSCRGKVVACKWTASCADTVVDALEPKNETATRQYSWTFTTTGFTGTSALYVPPAKSLPKGCTATVRVTGTKH